MNHDSYMALALELAQKGQGAVAPNPMVGAIIVKDDKIIGQGYHAVYGGPHAEINAFSSCSQDPKGATLYVTLEPCCHYGKTPPCTEAIIRHGIKTVVIGTRDPNPKVSGKGVEALRANGIEVIEDVLLEACVEINRAFIHHIKTQMPYIALKYAMTIDGKIASKTGHSKWISNEASRERVQELRKQFHGIMVGIGTVLKDDPLLTYRANSAYNPIRIICDRRLETPLHYNIPLTSHDVKTYYICSELYLESQEGQQKAGALKKRGGLIVGVPEKNGHINLTLAMKQMGELGIQSILLEGGSRLNEAMIASQLVDYLYAFIAPKILGGETAYTPVSGLGVETMGDAVILKLEKMTVINEDILLEYGFEDRGEKCLQD